MKKHLRVLALMVFILPGCGNPELEMQLAESAAQIESLSEEIATLQLSNKERVTKLQVELEESRLALEEMVARQKEAEQRAMAAERKALEAIETAQKNYERATAEYKNLQEEYNDLKSKLASVEAKDK